MFNGTAAEIFGDKALIVDKIARSIGYRRLADKSFPALSQEVQEVLQTYSDGVNAYVANVSLTGAESSGKLFPPEMIALGMKGIEPWTPQDTLALSRMMGLQLTWNFSLDYTREAVRQMHPDLAELVEELIPFTSNFMQDLVTIMDEDDLKAQK